MHCLLDGRDVPPTSGMGYIEELEARWRRSACGKIATVMGRYWAMDRDNMLGPRAEGATTPWCWAWA